MEELSIDILMRYFASGLLGVVTVRYLLETVRGYRDVVDSPGWLRTEGEITISELKKRWGRYGRTAEAIIEYRFEVDGVEHYGSTIKPGFEFTWDTSIPGLNSEAVKFKRFPLGKKVTVYYDRHDPGHCCLEHRSLQSMVMFNILSFAALSGVLYMFFFSSEPIHIRF